MLSVESKVDKRHQKILDQLKQMGKVKVHQLSRDLTVTEETIRRDLEFLEKQKLLIRTRGGAIQSSSEGFEIPSLEREKKHLKEKKNIADVALKEIKEGEIIAIDASTTTLQMARKIPNIPLTVITNSIHVSIELSRKEHVTVILTGGYLRTESMSLVGVTSDKIINDYHINTFFISCTGIDVSWGVSDSHELQARTKQRIAELADRIVVLADHTKFDQRSLIRWLPIDSVDTIITSSSLDAAAKRRYEEKNFHLVLA
ncbi:DeoR/GlpR family DNA-binding transcription regulator [Alkalicoccus halolimnae]|uniref:DeoR/GlpR family DNA-binding transcription regulator n=1 Tax=Alkalicoccus halolimnae TaxID=1667239 RepID=A0A5C7F612_9BACI|nr:DeoR/GlpR family DNA-binding transcription regulator [Alkalicoccus halolimnae]TXF86161.1 DeoR/GlpR transcriptional regulator [Alkalicoccus halolimnae]